MPIVAFVRLLGTKHFMRRTKKYRRVISKKKWKILKLCANSFMIEDFPPMI